MPPLPNKLCAEGCGTIIEGDQRYCAEHQQENRSTDQRRAHDKFRNANDPFRSLYFTARWVALRLCIKIRDKLCRICGHKAIEAIDHIIPARIYVVERNGGDIETFWHENNLQGLCKGCHDHKTATVDRALLAKQ